MPFASPLDALRMEGDAYANTPAGWPRRCSTDLMIFKNIRGTPPDGQRQPSFDFDYVPTPHHPRSPLKSAKRRLTFLNQLVNWMQRGRSVMKITILGSGTPAPSLSGPVRDT